jgi:hypothetical protein
MSTAFLGFRLSNLLVPDDAQNFAIRIGPRTWEFDREPDFAARKTAIEQGKCHETYVVEVHVDTGNGRVAALDTALEELLVISLGLSYVSQLSVAPTRSLPASEVSFVQPGDHFPRPRAMVGGNWAANNLPEFVDVVEAFARDYAQYEQLEKTRLLVHHWLDGMACWSMEDLVLSTATTLEIIAATAGTVAATTGQTLTKFNPRLAYAATRFSLPPLSSAFRNMRNDLVHQGQLSITNFANKDRDDCAQASADALNWVDQYMHRALGLGSVRRTRFASRDFFSLNFFSLD